ncbi:3-oxoacyl-ACP synthase III [Kocuria dechangensis]|uniref:3-oxoacyl-ACP synthase III n=1 Tax=Kocuria dechangensis TaxID=1176249 RepID=A0A917LX85_9MICC|nr:3-oxoacyl-ACP synthase III [Kocuria dechangensis]GGG65030.1 3-oxoacyl-ACP synthase III [Kocuria dechangensis]
MTGNSTIRHRNAALLAITKVEADEVVPSSRADEILEETFARLKMPKGLLERLAGVKERREWAPGRHFTDGAVEAGEAALAQAGVRPDQVGLLINASVTRDGYEPAVSVAAHHRLGLPSSALNFDVTNACLGFVNAVTIASTMVDAGAIEYAVVIAGEDPSPWHRDTYERLQAPDVTREQVVREFATLTLGSGAAAAVVGRADRHPEGHRIVGSVARSATEHHGLCIGGFDGMYTDATGLLKHGVGLLVDAWHDAHEDGWDWTDMDRYIGHQVSMSHTNKLFEDVGIDPERFPLTFPFWGNVAAAALPMTLALEAERLEAGQRVLCLGVGSGLNSTYMEIEW